MSYKSNRPAFSGLSIITIIILCSIIYIGFKYVFPILILIGCILALLGFFKEE